MRVTENKPSATHAMGKKKHKLRKGKSHDYGSDSSDEEAIAVSSCSHLSKAINLNIVKKTLKRVGGLGECTPCREGGHKADDHGKASDDVEEVEESLVEAADPTVWLCLQCGHQGCDRNSRFRHALQHYQTPRSTSHAVVVNLNTWHVWCYGCDDEVSVTCNGKLQESVEYLRKLMGASLLKPDSGGTLGVAGKKSEPAKTESEELVTDGDKQDKKKGEKKSGTTQQMVQKSGSFSGLPKVKGLNNLGNTCFFNAVMQNLSQTPVLDSLLRDHSKKGVELLLPGCQPSSSDTSSEEADSTGSSSATDEDGAQGSQQKLDLVPITLVLPEAGCLTLSVMSFLRDMSSSTKLTTISPSNLFGQVSKKAPRFKGFQQQDSHELLRHLLDGMKAEEIKRSQAAILQSFRLPENVQPKQVKGDVKAKLKEYGRQVKHTFVDTIFGGSFISTVLCEECRVPSQILEPFLDISVPITEQKVQRPTHLWPGGKKLEEQRAQKASQDPSVSFNLDGTVMDQPSKHALKKVRRQAKKDSKRKNRGGKKGRRVLTHGAHAQDDEAADAATVAADADADADADAVEDEDEDGPKANVDGQCHSDEDISDADVEDNLESDASRNRFQTMDTPEDSNNDCAHGPPTACDNASSVSVNGTVSPDALTPAGHERTSSISSTTDSTVTITEENVDDRSQSRESVGHLTQQVASLSMDSGRKSPRVGLENPATPCSPQAEGGAVNGLAAAPKPSRGEMRQATRICAMQPLGERYHPKSRECSVQSCLAHFTMPELLTGNNKFGCDSCSRKQYVKNGKQGKREMVYTNASKQVLIFSPPAVLTLHLKRFQQVGFRTRKINYHVDFPMVLDLAPNCSALCQGVKAGQTRILYSLYGVVEHTGQLSAGHYTAYVKVRHSNNISKVQRFLSNCDINNKQKLDSLLETMENLHRQHHPQWPGAATAIAAPEDAGNEEAVLPPVGKWYYISDSRVHEVVNENNILQCQAYLLFYERIY